MFRDSVTRHGSSLFLLFDLLLDSIYLFVSRKVALALVKEASMRVHNAVAVVGGSWFFSVVPAQLSLLARRRGWTTNIQDSFESRIYHHL